MDGKSELSIPPVMTPDAPKDRDEYIFPQPAEQLPPPDAAEVSPHSDVLPHTPLDTQRYQNMGDMTDLLKALQTEALPGGTSLSSEPALQQIIEQKPNLLQQIGLFLKKMFSFWKKKPELIPQ